MNNRQIKTAALSLFIFLFPTIALGITTAGHVGNKVTVEAAADSRQETIFLLSWDDNFLQTSKGTLSTIGVKIVDHADIDRKKLPRLKKLPIVKFTTKDNQIIQVDIYPPR